jgi:transposase-like protein
LKRKHRGHGDIFYIDEVFVKINGKQHYLWQTVDQDVWSRLNTIEISGSVRSANGVGQLLE